MFLVALVCMSVRLFLDNITQKLMNGLGWTLATAPGWHNEEQIKFCLIQIFNIDLKGRMNDLPNSVVGIFNTIVRWYFLIDFLYWF